MTKVTIVDFNLGNLHSVKKACEVCNIPTSISSDKNDIEKADALILPGVGAYREAMLNLSNMGLVQTIKSFAESGKPVFGICIGLQLLLSESTEFGHTEGLNLFEGRVEQIKFTDEKSYKHFRVPFIGWNKICYVKNSPIFESIKDNEYFYFVHSYYGKLSSNQDLVAYSIYGDLEITAAIERKNIFATQFHPEKSGDCGLQIYRNWAKKYNLN